jgi:Big-like domain-containing protein
LAILFGTLQLLGCGGGGDGSSPPHAPESSPSTTFVGNLKQPASPASVVRDDAMSAATVVQVCVVGTSFCTEVDASGTFTLDAHVSGDVTLIFDGPDFTARLTLVDVPPGATVTIHNIECDTGTGQCHAEDVEIAPAANAPPICDDATARPEVAWPPNHQLVQVTIDGVTDPDGDPVSITATSVFQDEPVDAPGSGNTGPDAQLTPLAVRAERSGQGNGRVYTITFTADDGRGGTCSGTVQVCVPHDRGMGADCVDDGARFNSL